MKDKQFEIVSNNWVKTCTMKKYFVTLVLKDGKIKISRFSKN